MNITNCTPCELTFGNKEHPFQNIRETQLLAKAHNIINTMDWIPLVGVISGIARCLLIGTLSLIHKDKLNRDIEAAKNTKTWFKIEMARGAVSTLGLGFLFMVPDIIFNMNRSQREANRFV